MIPGLVDAADRHPLLALLLVLALLWALHLSGCKRCRRRLRGGSKARRRMDQVGRRSRGAR